MTTAQHRPKAAYSFKVVAAWRERIGVSQARLGQMLGISRDHVSKLENGTREFTQAMQFACERLSIQVAVAAGELGLVLPAALDDVLRIGVIVADLDKETSK